MKKMIKIILQGFQLNGQLGIEVAINAQTLTLPLQFELVGNPY
jgi:hypothetical protein